MPRFLSQRGQAAAELAAVIPFVVVATLAAAQFALVGFALWSAGGAARAGARAELVGDDGEEVAVAAVPKPFHASATIAGSRVRLEVRAPSLLPGVRMPAVSSSAQLDPAGQGGP